MKKVFVKLVALVAFAGLIIGLAGCCSLIQSCLPPPLTPTIWISSQPESLLVYTNTEADFSVYAVVAPSFTTNGLTYQWQVNTVLLDSMNPNANWTNCTCPGATTPSISITNVKLSDVGYYRVLVSAPGASTVTSAAPYLQAITEGSIFVNGTPIAGTNGGGNYCGPYSGYILYTNNPRAGSWGYAVVDTTQPITAADGGLSPNGSPTPGTQVAYVGKNGDSKCSGPPPPGSGGSISKSPPYTYPNGSLRYEFTLYFPSSPPTGTYRLQITNLQQ